MAFYGLIRHVQGRRLDAERWLRRAIEAAQQSNALEALAHAYFVARLGAGRAGPQR